MNCMLTYLHQVYEHATNFDSARNKEKYYFFHLISDIETIKLLLFCWAVIHLLLISNRYYC